jgi:hypothetical protein
VKFFQPRAFLRLYPPLSGLPASPGGFGIRPLLASEESDSDVVAESAESLVAGDPSRNSGVENRTLSNSGSGVLERERE